MKFKKKVRIVTIRAFLQKNKFITYCVLISYMFMSLGHSGDVNLGALETGKSINLSISLPEKLKRLDQSSGYRQRLESEETHVSASPFSKASTPTDRVDVEYGSSQIVLGCAGGGIIEVADGENSESSCEGGAELSALENSSIDVAKDKEGKKNESTQWTDTILFSKKGFSGITSLTASSGLALFSYNLGLKADEVLAYVLGGDALISNAILYHKVLMGLSVDDFMLKPAHYPYQSMQTLGSIPLKFCIALISSIPLAFVTYLVNLNYSEGFAVSSCVASLICTIPLFYKAQTGLLNYMDYISGIVNEKDDYKRERKWSVHNASEELSALGRDEVHSLYESFSTYKKGASEGDPSDVKLEDFISHLLPTNIDTHNRFWLKEGFALGFGGFSAVFGGMYLFLVGNPIYEAFLPVASHVKHLDFLADDYKTTALAAAIALTIGQNALQAKNAYDISKLYAIKAMRSYEEQISGRNQSFSSKRDINAFQKYKEHGVDILKAVLAGGAATARAALALSYIDNPALLACVLVGTDISYIATFWWGMGYIESGTETEIKRNEMLAFLNANKKTYIENNSTS